MTHHEERTAPAGRPPQKMVRLAAEPCKHSRTTARPQRQSLIDAAREASRRAHAEALALGGRHGANLDALALCFARRARALGQGGTA